MQTKTFSVLRSRRGTSLSLVESCLGYVPLGSRPRMDASLMPVASRILSSFLSGRFQLCHSTPWARRPVLVSRSMSTCSSRANSSNVLEFLDSLKNYEKLGVPKGAGTESTEGFDLARMNRLLSALEDPLSHYPVIHVAGTKGKGSTAAFISNILRAEGYCVGSYTSPHLLSIHERIIAGKTDDPISKDAFEKLFQDNRKVLEEAIAAEQGHLTYFEVLTALAFQYFANSKVDIAVVEAGLGGARDATNVISAAGLAAAVITNIGKEHLAALGGSIETIALVKAGIIKQGRPVVLGGPLDLHLEEIICKVAASKDSKIIRAFGEGVHHEIVDVRLEDGGALQRCDISIDLTSSGRSLNWKLQGKSLQLQLLGSHQLDNAVTAICTILCIQSHGWQVQESAIWSGLAQTSLLGRCQVLTRAEAIKLDCELSALVLDGAHTASSAKALASTLKMVFPFHSLALVVAMASDKDHLGFCTELLSGVTPKVIVVSESVVAGGKSRSTSASDLAECWYQAAKLQNLEAKYCLTGSCIVKKSESDSVISIAKSISVISGVKKASDLIKMDENQKGVVCVTGSLHAVSEVLNYLKASM